MNCIMVLVYTITSQMVKKEETLIRRVLKKYDEVNKKELKKATEQFNTRISRKYHEEICTFLEAHNIYILVRSTMRQFEQWIEEQNYL